MSSETPAAHVARLKVTHQAWRIARDGHGAVAVHRENRSRRLAASTLAALEACLIEAGADRRAPRPGSEASRSPVGATFSPFRSDFTGSALRRRASYVNGQTFSTRHNSRRYSSHGVLMSVPVARSI
jgi:hypothetical protein